MQDELLRERGGAEVGGQESSKPMGKLHLLNRCLLTKVIPSQKCVQLLEALVQRYTAM